MDEGIYTAYIESYNAFGDYIKASPITFSVTATTSTGTTETQLVTDNPSEPTQGIETEPITDKPMESTETEPVETNPTEPTTTEPTQPTSETPTESTSTEPTQPISETPTETQPVTDTPTEPTDLSTEPTKPTEPITSDGWVVVKAPACEESGVEVNYSTQESRTIPALGHNTEIIGKKSATYFAKGYTGDETCTVCSKVVSKGKAIAKLKLATPKVKITACKKKLTVKYTKVKDATGFQVKYTYKGKTTTNTYTSKKSVTKAIKKLKKGTYKVSVRALIKSKGKTAYSKWTTAKKVKVKK